VNNYIVKDLMVPISEYATVQKGATLIEAVMSLEDTQEIFHESRYAHRAVLILDENKQVIGKMSQMDFLRALEPKDDNLDQIRKFKQFGFTTKAVNLQQEEYLKISNPILDTYSEAAKLKVSDFMKYPTEGDYIDENTTMDMALHQLTVGSILSLLVTNDKGIVGILRLSDVFTAVSVAMKESQSQLSWEVTK